MDHRSRFSLRRDPSRGERGRVRVQPPRIRSRCPPRLRRASALRLRDGRRARPPEGFLSLRRLDLSQLPRSRMAPRSGLRMGLTKGEPRLVRAFWPESPLMLGSARPSASPSGSRACSALPPLERTVQESGARLVATRAFEAAETAPFRRFRHWRDHSSHGLGIFPFRRHRLVAAAIR